MGPEQIVTLLQQGRIRGRHSVWREGLPTWLPLHDAPEFAFLLNRTVGPSAVTILQQAKEPASPATMPPPRRRSTLPAMVFAVAAICSFSFW